MEPKQFGWPFVRSRTTWPCRLALAVLSLGIFVAAAVFFERKPASSRREKLLLEERLKIAERGSPSP